MQPEATPSASLRNSRENTDAGYQVVEFRRRGNEVLLHERRSSVSGNELAIHEVAVDGRLPKIGTVWTGRNLEDWLSHHQYYLEWVHPDLKVDR
ncbi:hypothetical protein [Halostagnicola kamekurae]|uniref:Uncharacterized protein n=1 Tax=Halostagnicola kamekurae TaxID=619731 RepID=A0A1I6PPF0_9EURY|nr:hypothetical protein [Halostagnicola kamekurae]SFS42077.1 hypothetical protein SAMN04488556_0701 [Halostagnicola kamekurae]